MCLWYVETSGDCAPSGARLSPFAPLCLLSLPLNLNFGHPDAKLAVLVALGELDVGELDVEEK